MAFRYVFRDPKVDVRYLIAGAVLPNLIDKPLGTLIAPDFYGADRLYGHSLLLPTVLMAVVLLATRRGRRRRALMAVAIGMMLHLVLDGMWTSAQTFLWPFFGWDFAPGASPYWSGWVDRELLSPVAIAQEVAGAAYLAYLARKTGLSDLPARRTFLTTGRLTA